MKNPNWRKCLLCGDSKDIIKRIPDNSIDFILTDPPYNIGKHSTGNIPLVGRTPMNNDVADWDLVDFNPEEWADEFIRILKPNGNLFIFTSYNQLGRWYTCLDHKFDTSNFMIWHKTNPAPKIFKAGFLNSCEMIFTCWNKKHTWNFISQSEMHNFLESPICMRPERLSSPKHPAQKPVSILKKMIRIASNPNDVIFDPFMGVGSVGVAAMSDNRKFIGVEINKDYFDAAKERIENELITNIKDADMLTEPDFESMYNQDIEILEELIDSTIIKHHTNKLFSFPKQEIELQPILKWPGGKEKELKYILPNIPKAFNNYFEPFVGGGSVFTAIKANKYYINDFSTELISMYRYISEQDEKFFHYCSLIDTTWNNTSYFFEKNLALVELYIEYRKGTKSKNDLKCSIESFCISKEEEILHIVGDEFDMHIADLLSEMKNNLFRKMSRMKDIEFKKNILPQEDLYRNIETALKSAVYMYFRHLYNDSYITNTNAVLHCALFLFIRNYSYSGMFRYNDNGEFNVPYGGIAYNNKKMEKKLNYYRSLPLQTLFNKSEIFNMDFEDFLSQTNPQSDDFIFLDPPYDSEFSTYANNDFTHKDQERLAYYLTGECKAKWMMIIKYTDFIYSLYNKKGINIRAFDKKYVVSFMNRNNKDVKHLIITNYLDER